MRKEAAAKKEQLREQHQGMFDSEKGGCRKKDMVRNEKRRKRRGSNPRWEEREDDVLGQCGSSAKRRAFPELALAVLEVPLLKGHTT